MPLPKLTPPSMGGGGGLPKLNGDMGPTLPPLGGGGTEPSDPDTSFDGTTLAGLGLGAAALVGGAALASNAGTVGKVARGLNALRQQLMLSGMAPIKSVLGNGGAALTAAIERGDTAPLREMFSLETLKDAARNFRNGPAVTTNVSGNAMDLPLPFSAPSRIMGAFDEAAQSALRRAGLSAKDATNEVLQTPLGENVGKLGSYLDNPAATYMLPFRRTPFNQAIEGAKLVQKAYDGDAGARRLLMVSMGGGAVHGAATADDNHPMTVPLAVSAAGRAGLPYAVGALIGRYYLGGANSNGDIPSNMLPVSEYGLDQSIKDPTRPFTKPAALSALEKLTQ